MGLNLSMPKQQSPLVQPAISGEIALIKILVGRYIASYVNSKVHEPKYDPKLQNYVNMPDDAGNTPLIGAVYGGHIEIVKFLVEKCGADIKIKNKMGCSPIWVAAGYSKLSELQFLISLVIRTEGIKELSQSNNSGDSPFLAAVSKGHLDAVKILINTIEKYVEGSSGNNQIWKLLCTENKAGDSPLSVAVGSGCDSQLLNYLLDKEEACIKSMKIGKEEFTKRPLNLKNSHGLSPIMVACERNNVGILQELIRRGAVITGDSNGRSPLAVASFCGCFDVAEYLISSKHGKDMVNESDENGCTPVWLAARTGNVKMLKLLVKAGADISIKGADDLSVEEVAEKYKKNQVVDYFRNMKVN